MGLVSLYLFTLLGGLAAGTYVMEACLLRKREGDRPWLIPVVVVMLFAIGVAAAATHVSSIPRALSALTGGTMNFGSGMVREVLVAGLFLVLALIDMIIVLVKKDSPDALRIVTAIVGIVCIVFMGTAYIDVYGVAIWTNAPATVVSFIGGALAMGIAAYALLAPASYTDGAVRITAIVANIVLAIGIVLEIMAFSGAGADVMMQVVGLIVAPVASLALVFASAKFANQRTLAAIVCVLAIVGVAVARWSFYAVCTVL